VEGFTVLGNATTPANTGLGIGNTNAKIYAGEGLPENVVTADRGSIFLRTNGGPGYTFYVKESNDGTNTGWVSK
jgi:hypothetical protein